MTRTVHRPRRAVFLDRDGVLNPPVIRDGCPFPPSSLAQFELYPEVPLACARLRQDGFALVVVTNQPDVARGTLDVRLVEAMHDRLRRELPLDGVFTCLHDDADRCRCRKPAPGLLVAAAAELALDLERSFMVGDRWRDVEAGRRAGCRTVHVDRGYQERAPEGADASAPDLAEAVRWIAEQAAVRGDDR
jgi:D-glycero-D-manno-heptose 1,7-bisphosphate phosphatase